MNTFGFSTESMPIRKTNPFLLLLIALLLLGSNINVPIYGPVTLSAYFYYAIIGAFLAVVVGLGVINNKQSFQLTSSMPVVVFGLLAIYCVCNGLINTNGGINLRHYIMLVDAFLLLSYCLMLSNGSINLLAVGKVVTFISIIESLICILQQLSVTPSLDTLFKVTGSNANPNVTAMFLAMAFPALLLLLFRGGKASRIVAIFSITICVIALVLLQCRTAFIGTAVGTLLILNHEYRLWHGLRNRLNKAVLMLACFVAISLFSLAILFLYNSKKASSDGRVFIWKISLQAIAQKPIFGSGYGMFEHDYNLAQANYFAKKTATQQEIYNAGYVHMGYNEFLENLFEGGWIGLVLFVGLLVPLLIYPAKGDYYVAYAGIATFTVMCFFNFTVQALPVRALFVLYAGVCCVAPCKGGNHVVIDLTTIGKLSNLILQKSTNLRAGLC